MKCKTKLYRHLALKIRIIQGFNVARGIESKLNGDKVRKEIAQRQGEFSDPGVPGFSYRRQKVDRDTVTTAFTVVAFRSDTSVRDDESVKRLSQLDASQISYKQAIQASEAKLKLVVTFARDDQLLVSDVEV